MPEIVARIRVSSIRRIFSEFLKNTGCYDICANCPVYGPDGCCSGCSNLVRGKGCGTPNLSCLAYTCTTLNGHLAQLPSKSHTNKLLEWVALTSQVLRREGYRGQERLPNETKVEVTAPLKIQLGDGREGC